MGTDIYSYAETRGPDGKWSKVGEVFEADEFDREEGKDKTEEPLGDRSYALFGWLADVRNYSDVTPISEPRGIPEDASPEVAAEYNFPGGYSASWLSLEEMLAVDYDAEVIDKRITRDGDGGATGTEEEGERMTLRDFLGAESEYMTRLQELRQLGDPKDVRVVFWFDS